MFLFLPIIGGPASFFFFFQAEDGIRDYKVTGVQTCALPISVGSAEVDRVAAELARRDLERYARPRRRFLENHRQGLACEGPVASAAVLVGKARVEDRPQLARVELVDV